MILGLEMEILFDLGSLWCEMVVVRRFGYLRKSFRQAGIHVSAEHIRDSKQCNNK